MKKIIIILTLFLTFLEPKAMGQSFNVPDSVFYRCFVTANMELWKRQMLKLEKLPGITQNFESLRRLAFAQYGYVGFLFENERADEAEEVLDNLEKSILRLENMQPSNYEIMALHGALYGLKINLQKWKAPAYGMKSMSFINDAVANDSINGYIYSEKANMTYHMPSFVGGGRENAIPVIEKAVFLMDEDISNKTDNWLYLHVNTTLARWYIEEKEWGKAERQVQKILTLEPKLQWVRNELLPPLKEMK